MNIRLEDLHNLPLSTRLQLVEDLWDGIAAEIGTEPLPESLMIEIDRRFDSYLKNPAQSMSLEDIQKQMGTKR